MNDLKFTQNFLHSERLVEQIVALADIRPGDTVLEIGPGKGIITAQLAARVTADGHVVAVELDADLVGKLEGRFKDTPQVSIVHGDVLKLDLGPVLDDQLVFSNIPFNITSDVLDLLFTRDQLPLQAHLILQREALISRSAFGEGETLKSLLIKPRCRVQIVYTFSPADFAPRPGVDTALFQFDLLDDPLVADDHYGLYKDFLAYVSKDRVGEGAWRRAFAGRQLKALTASTGLITGRGIKSQTCAAMVEAFELFLTDRSKWAVVTGAMTALRQEQAAREEINRTGGHHRSRGRPR
jgi:23S rRNA (adenine-N6)-dimethyltransferase